MDARGRVERPPREFRAEVFSRFHDALEPLRAAGKLGGILLQFPPYVVHKPVSFEYLEWAQDQLQGDEALVEFRHHSWLEEEHRADTLGFLEETRHDARRHGLAADRGREEHGADRLGEHVPNGLCPAARPQRRDLERPRWKRGRALQLPLFGGGAT